ncbi:uncharacterized protein LOC144180578 [Haemaphysalis longicornis]
MAASLKRVRLLHLPLRAALVLLALTPAEAIWTKGFYDLMQRQAVMTYECYRTGATLEPEDTVNFAILWDGTKPEDTNAVGTTWSETRGMLDSNRLGNLTTYYDNSEKVGKLTTSTVTENLEVLLPPYEGGAYYVKLTLTSENNRVVYKIYDRSRSCQDATTLLYKTCSGQKTQCNPGEENGVPDDFGCSEMKFTRYPDAQPFPVCGEYHACT